MKKILIILGLLIIIVLGVFAFYTISENPNDDKKTLTVYSEGPYELSEKIEDIKNLSYYEGYDSETVQWMESLGDKCVFESSNEIVIMSQYDASKLHSEFVTDAYITEDFSCNIKENRSLGTGKNFKDVLYVENVEYIDEEIHYIEDA